MEVKVILDKLFYRDICGIIESYLFTKCIKCKKDTLVEEENESVRGGFYCFDCSNCPMILKCADCKKLYNINDSQLSCFICVSNCRLYCSKCYTRKRTELITDEITDIPHLNLYWILDMSLDIIDGILTDYEMDI